MTTKDYKALSIREFTKAAQVYESSQAGIYRMCRKDYPDVLAELEKEPFNDLLESKTQNLIQINDCPLRGVA